MSREFAETSELLRISSANLFTDFMNGFDNFLRESVLSFELLEVGASTQEVSNHVVALLLEHGHVLMKCCVPKQFRRLLADLHREEGRAFRVEQLGSVLLAAFAVDRV